MTPEEFAEIFQLTDFQQKQFERYFELLVEWNEKMNLTTITEHSEVYLKHFYDSSALIFLKLIENKPLDLLDIGAGAGFPSFPMKIIFPELKITIIDSLAKRISFLDFLKDELKLSNIRLLHGRAEDLGQDVNYRERFDLVTARAVARLNVLSELTLPFLKIDGQLFSYKASKYKEEVNESSRALILLNGKVEQEIDYQLPNGDERHLIIVKKEKATDKKYPRRAGLPNKSPL